MLSSKYVLYVCILLLIMYGTIGAVTNYTIANNIVPAHINNMQISFNFAIELMNLCCFVKIIIKNASFTLYV